MRSGWPRPPGGACACPALPAPGPIRRPRDLTRYRRALVRGRAREKQRPEKIADDAQIKLSAAVSGLPGVSGRATAEALTAGERSPRAPARPARGTVRNKTRIPAEALTGHPGDHHGFSCQMMPGRTGGLPAQTGQLDARAGQAIAPYSRQVTRLGEIAGAGTTSARELIAGTGADMSRFPAAGHLVSRAKPAPIGSSPAGKKKGGSAGKGQP